MGGKASVVSISDLIAGNKIATITIDGIANTINETITSIGALTYDSVTGLLTIPYTDETGTVNSKTVTVAPTFVNTDGQQITGDNSGTVDLTLTEVIVGGVTNYTVKADLNVAATTPSGDVNQLKWDATLNGYYVEPATANAPLHQRDVVIATASQTSFAVTKTPIGGSEMVFVTRNSVDISDSFTWSGTTGTYDPALNGGHTMDAGDIVKFHYEAF